MELFGIKIPSEVIKTVIIILVAFILNLIIKTAVKKIINLGANKTKHEQKRRETVLVLLRKVIKYIIIVIAFITILSTWHVNTTALVTSIGALSVVVGLAFQDLLKDFLVGISIIMEDTFSLGDYVEINGFKGEVINFNFKSTRLKSLTGEVRIISNRNIIEVTNYSLNKSLLLVNISTSYDTDIDKVEKILKDVCVKLEKNEIYNQIVLAPGIEELSDSAVIYRISALVNIKDIYNAKRFILEEVKKSFDKNNINIPFPQVEVHNAK